MNGKKLQREPCNRRGLPTPMVFRRIKDRLIAAPCTSSRFRMLFRPCRWTRLIPPASYRCAKLLSVSSLNPSVRTLIKVANALGVSLSMLFEGDSKGKGIVNH
jgi:hypothetical protein